MRLVERLRQKSAQAKRLKASGGLAMLLVVIVLSMLLVVGVLFTATANLDVQAAAYYRQATQAGLFALEGLYRAMAELHYDVWGVDESQAFKCAEPDHPETDTIGENELQDAAYYTTKAPPSPRDAGGAVKAPWSRYRRSVVPAIRVERDGAFYPVFNDLRWMVGKGDPYGTRMYVGKVDDRPLLEFAIHSAAPYHDEFLPEFTDNSDVWELGLHLNRGDVFGRGYMNDDSNEGGHWEKGVLMKRTDIVVYWPGNRPAREFDYIDTRIAGDSFYKIFRFELIDPATKKSYAAGMDPVTGRYIEPGFTHEGNATTATYVDRRGGAKNINQVNNNYRWELYWGWDVAAATQDDRPDSMADYHTYHYNESKWIYVYNTKGDRKLGRYAVMVWPDGGCPNANMQYDVTEIENPDWTGTLRSTRDYFKSLDYGFTPHGGFVGGHTQADGITRDYPVTNNIVSEGVEDHTGERWYDALGTRIGDYKGAEGPFAETGGGLITSRAEMNMFIRKACFTEAANAGLDGWTHEDAARDAYIITSLVTVNGYEYLLDHHWANDRLVLDKLGLSDGLQAVTRVRSRPIRSDSSFFAPTADGRATRARYAKILDELRFMHGPDCAREGRHTQYHDPQDPQNSWKSLRAKIAKATPISWLAHRWFYTFSDFRSLGNRPYWVSMQDLTWDDLAVKDDVMNDPCRVVCRIDSPQLSEVGKYTFPHVDNVPRDLEGREPWGWGDRYDPTGQGNPNQVYFDGSEKYFVELVRYWERVRERTCMSLDENWQLYVNGIDILGQEGYCHTTRVIGVDNKSSSQGTVKTYISPEDDWSPKVTPAEESFLPSKVPGEEPEPANHFSKKVWANRAMGSGCGYGGHKMAMFCFNKHRMHVSDPGQSPWVESWLRVHAANYLVITFDPTDAVRPKADGTTTIVLTRSDYVMDVAHLSGVGVPGPLQEYDNVFDCGFDAYDPVNNQYATCFFEGSKPVYYGCWAPNFLDRDPERASPAWRGVYDRGRTHWHNRPKIELAEEEGRWLDGLNYHHIMAYLPGGEQAPSSSKYPFTMSCPLDRAGAISLVAAGSQERVAGWGGRGGARDWESLVSAPTGFWADLDHVLSDSAPDSYMGDAKYAPDPLLRIFADLMRVTPLERVITAGYFGNYHDDIGSLGEHVIYDEVDNDMDGHIDNLTAEHIADGAPGHYMADRKVIGRMNINEMQHPAAIWYGGFCNGKFGSQNLLAGRKPLKGYTSWVECITRASYYSESPYHRQADTPYDMLFWWENQWGDMSSDQSPHDLNLEEWRLGLKDTSRVLFAGNSPVYTVYVTGQVLHDGKDPIAETKLRATVERTWDGKMNVLEFSWIPKDIMEE